MGTCQERRSINNGNRLRNIQVYEKIWWYCAGGDMVMRLLEIVGMFVSTFMLNFVKMKDMLLT